MLEFFNVHNLDCIGLVGFLVLCFINIAVLTLAYLLKQNIIFDYFVH